MLGKAGAAVAVLGREVGAAEEGFALGVEPDAHGPAAAAGAGLHEGHVEAIDIGTLLAVDLDVDEVLVHEPRRCRGARRTRGP